MAKKSIFQETNIEVLISNLRGEVGDIIQAWAVMRDFYIIANQLQTDDTQKDLENQRLNKVYLVRQKFKDDIIARLSELGHRKYGQVSFHFAADKLKVLKKEVDEFEAFLVNKNFRAKRNEFISHKKLPAKWEEHRAAHRISYLTILKGIAKAVILMKKFDLVFLGEKSRYQWIEMRKRRYCFGISAKADYFLMPHIVYYDAQ